MNSAKFFAPQKINRKLSSSLLMLQVLFLANSISAMATAASIIEVSEYHGDELKAKAGSQWFGLYQEGKDNFRLKQTSVAITKCHDAIIDETPKELSGKKVTVSTKDAPLFLVEGVGALKAGKVITSAINLREHLQTGTKLKLNVGAKFSTMSVSGDVKEKEYRTNYTIVLESNGVKQTILKHNQIGADTAPSLVWAGDLDGDGKLDLVMDTTDDYNVRDLTLFLSSKAKPGKLVEKVANQFSTGC